MFLRLHNNYDILIWGGLYYYALSHLKVVQYYILKRIDRKNKYYQTKKVCALQIVSHDLYISYQYVNPEIYTVLYTGY